MAKLPELIRHAPHIERHIHAALAERARKPSSRDGRLGMSEIGKCERALWAKLNGVAPDSEMEPRMLLLFDHGHAIEDHVVESLRLAGFQIEDRQMRLSDPDFGQMFVGHIDGKILLGSKPAEMRWHLLEIKSASAKRFEELQGVGYASWNPGYADQLQVYMGYAGLSDSLAVVYNKDRSDLYAEKIRFDPGRFAVLRAKAQRILEADDVLDRPEQAKSQYCGFCKWCDWNKWCWGPTAGVRFDD